MLMRKPALYFALGFLLAGHAVAADPQIAQQDAQIAAVEAEIAGLQKRRSALLASLTPLSDKVGAMEVVRGHLEGVATESGRQIGKLQKQLLQLDKEIAKLTAPYDLTVAWKRYDQASGEDKREAFKDLFRLARGREPNNEEMAQSRLEAKILEVEIRKKVAVPMGLALARIGNTLVEFPKFVAGLIATVESKSLEIANNVNSAVQALKSVIDGVAGDPELAGRLKPQLQGASASLNNFQGATDPINKVLGLADDAKAKAQAMADDSYRQFKESVYGTVDPNSAREKAQREHAELAATITRLRAGLGDLDPRRDMVRGALASMSQALAEVRGEVKRVDEAIASAQAKLEQAQERKADLEFQAKMADIKLQPLLRGVSLWVALPRGQRELHLAVDDVTAHNLKLPRAGAYSLNLRMYQAGPVGCLYDCKASKDGKSSRCSRSTMQVLWDAPNLPRFEGVVPQVEGSGISIDGRKQLIIASEPGEAVVEVPQPQGVVGYDSSRHPHYDQRPTHVSDMRGQNIQMGCTSNVKPIMGPVKETYGRYPVATHQIKSMRLLLQRPPRPGDRDYRRVEVSAGQAIDLFRANASNTNLHDRGWATLYPEITVLAGKAVQRRGISALAEMGGDAGAFDLRNQGGQLSLAPLGEGRGQLRLALADAGGKRHFEQVLDFTSSIIEGLSWEPLGSQPFQGARNISLPIGKTFDLRFVVRGKADMGGYRVRWTSGRPEAARGTEFAGSTGFRKDGDAWVAENHIRFTPERITGEYAQRGYPGEVLDMNALTLRAELVNPEGELIASQTGPQLTPMLPPLTDMKIAFLGSGAIQARSMDIFLPRPPDSDLGTIGLRFDYPGGRLILPIWVADIEYLGRFPDHFRVVLQRWSNQTGQMQLQGGNRRRNTLSTTETGTGTLLASFDALLGQERGLELAADYLHDTLPIRFNKLLPERLGSGNTPSRFRLRVVGPTDISAYTARWRFGDGRDETTRFEGAPWNYSSSTEQTHGEFEQVELISPTGKLAAVYLGSRDGQPLPSPTIHVQGVPMDSLTPGATVRVTASVSGVHEEDAGDFRCRWEVDPAFGTAAPTTSELRVDLIFGSCETTLKLADNPDLGGRSFPVKATLERQTGEQP